MEAARPFCRQSLDDMRPDVAPVAVVAPSGLARRYCSSSGWRPMRSGRSGHSDYRAPHHRDGHRGRTGDAAGAPAAPAAG